MLNLDDQELADAFVTFINQAVLSRLVSKDGKLPTIINLQEVPTMIGQRIERAKEKLAAEARSKGRQEGRQEGLQEGRRHERVAILRELLEQKFGAVDRPSEARLHEASLDQLLRWSRRVLAAPTLDDIFSDDGPDDRVPD